MPPEPVPEWHDPMLTVGYRQSAGVLEVPPELPGLNTIAPRQLQLLLDWESKVPRAVEWEVQLQQQDPTILAGGFPEAASSSGYLAGAYFDASNVWDSDASTCIICKVETGAGNNARVFYTDIRPGRFAMGVQTRMRISCGRWLGADAGGAVVLVQATIAPASFSDADPPTYSAQTRIPAGEARSLVTPPGAQWMDIQVSAAETQIEVTAYGCRFFKNTSLTAPLVFPPSTPWPVPLNGTVWSVANTGLEEAIVTVVFWVR